MNYSSISVDGKYGASMIELTPGQFEFIRSEIKLQEKGYGLLNGPYAKNYVQYWLEFPGTPVGTN